MYATNKYSLRDERRNALKYTQQGIKVQLQTILLRLTLVHAQLHIKIGGHVVLKRLYYGNAALSSIHCLFRTFIRWGPTQMFTSG